MTLEQFLALAVPSLVALISGIGGVIYGNRKGLPDIRQEVEEAKTELIGTYKAQIEAAEKRAEHAEKEAAECKAENREQQKEMVKQAKKIRELEAELTNVYRRLDAQGFGRSGEPRS